MLATAHFHFRIDDNFDDFLFNVDDDDDDSDDDVRNKHGYKREAKKKKKRNLISSFCVYGMCTLLLVCQLIGGRTDIKKG